MLNPQVFHDFAFFCNSYNLVKASSGVSESISSFSSSASTGGFSAKSGICASGLGGDFAAGLTCLPSPSSSSSISWARCTASVSADRRVRARLADRLRGKCRSLRSAARDSRFGRRLLTRSGTLSRRGTVLLHRSSYCTCQHRMRPLRPRPAQAPGMTSPWGSARSRCSWRSWKLRHSHSRQARLR